MWRDSGRGLILAGVAALALAACSDISDKQESAGGTPADSAPAANLDTAADAPATGELAALADRSAIPVSLPKMAYVFDYGFRLAGKDIAALEQKHADMCEAMGPYNCQIVSLSSTGEGDEITGKLEVAVVSDKARAFGGKLAESAKAAGSEQVSATIAGEDLSKQLVDTDARLQTRIALRDRLLDVLKTRKGTVAELVEAERGVAQVNEEIDQAKSWLQEMKGRVSFSRVVVNYESTSPAVASFLAPVRGVLSGLGSILGGVVAFLIALAAIGGPLALVYWGLRRVRRRWPPVEAA